MAAAATDLAAAETALTELEGEIDAQKRSNAAAMARRAELEEEARAAAITRDACVAELENEEEVRRPLPRGAGAHRHDFRCCPV